MATITRDKMPEFAKEKEIFFEHLRRAGFKKTTQRELILEVFLRTEGHLSAEDLYNIVKVDDPTVGFTTVYRTLKLLVECGLAREERLSDTHTRYEHLYNHQHHDHMICMDCGVSIEFFNDDIEALQDSASEQLGFKVLDHKLQIYGLCSACRRSG
jgi:Fur family ferric uptake transcriptional regulator